MEIACFSEMASSYKTTHNQNPRLQHNNRRENLKISFNVNNTGLQWKNCFLKFPLSFIDLCAELKKK
jgi:hypothetical protein